MTKTTIEELLPQIFRLLKNYAYQLEIEEDHLTPGATMAIRENPEVITHDQEMLMGVQTLRQELNDVLDALAEVVEDTGVQDTVTAVLA